MRRIMRRLLPLLGAILFVFFLLASAREQAPGDGLESSRNSEKGEFGAEQYGQLGAQGRKRIHDESDNGASAVIEAAAILRKIRPTPNGRSRYSKPSGVLDTTAYYAKELFVLLFMNGPAERDLLRSKSQPRKLSQPLANAVKLLEGAANQGNEDAMFMLAEMSFFGTYTHPRNYQEAFRRYEQLAQSTGNSTAQYQIGFMYATGIGDAVKQDQARAMLYYTFAAEGGDIRSEMTLAYRYHSGIATTRNCEKAVHHYKNVADEAIEYYRSGPPGGRSMSRNAYKIADEEGGVYGEGASVSSAGPNAKQGGPQSDAHAAFDDVLEYLDLMSRKGEVKATYSLGKLHYDGSRAMKRDFRTARQYFFDVARRYWNRDGRIRNDVDPFTEKYASKAAGYLGRMFLRGEGTEQSFGKALVWFNRGIQNGDALCQYSLGLMYLYGYGVPRDPVKAAQFFGPAADQDLAAAQVQLGALFLDQGDVLTAMKYFELAARNGHIEAYYYLAEISSKGIGRDRSCGMAAVYYKIVAERAEAILSPFAEANEAYENGDIETALIYYMMAAEQGFEAGQANVAYLLDQATPRFSLRSLIPFAKSKASVTANAALALVYWTRSAKESNIDSMVRMGDYYLTGLGTQVDSEKAAACYQAAAETMQSAQAFWNLGWMHENGIGIEQDFHLAKRFYDQALETNQKEAYLPVKLALLKLRVRSFWNTITRGRVNSIRDEPVQKRDWSLREWVNNFLKADGAWDEDFEEDGWDETPDMTGGDDFYEEIDNGILESLIIVGLAATLGFLVYYRQQRQLGQRRAREQQQRNAAADAGPVNDQPRAQEEERGLFPQPEDPDFNNWVAGGIGH